MIVTIIKHAIALDVLLDTINNIVLYLDNKEVACTVAKSDDTKHWELNIKIPEEQASPQNIFNLGIAIQLILNGQKPLR